MGLGFPKYAHAGSSDPVEVARELHDDIAEPLAGILINVHELRSRPEAAGIAGELAALEDSVREVLRQTREIFIDLRGLGALRLNFVRALRNEMPATDSCASTVLVGERWPTHINGWAAHNLLRIIRHAVANALRHGRARNIEILLDVEGSDRAVVAVVDDGIGIDGAQRGIGMLGMEERAIILGGTLSAAAAKAGGTRIEVRVPLRRLA